MQKLDAAVTRARFKAGIAQTRRAARHATATKAIFSFLDMRALMTANDKS